MISPVDGLRTELRSISTSSSESKSRAPTAPFFKMIRGGWNDMAEGGNPSEEKRRETVQLYLQSSISTKPKYGKVR
jgi:hypothetical protein